MFVPRQQQQQQQQPPLPPSSSIPSSISSSSSTATIRDHHHHPHPSSSGQPATMLSGPSQAGGSGASRIFEGQRQARTAVAHPFADMARSRSSAEPSTKAPLVLGAGGGGLYRSGSSSARYDPPLEAPTAPLPPPPPLLQSSSSSATVTLAFSSSAATASAPVGHSTRSGEGQPSSSKSVLTLALQKAQEAVRLDASEDAYLAISSYAEAVRLLGRVMDHMDQSERDRAAREAEFEQREREWDRQQLAKGEEGRREVSGREEKRRERREKAARKAQLRAEEGVRLDRIRATYASRIRELEADLASSGPSEDDTDEAYDGEDSGHLAADAPFLSLDSPAPSPSTVRFDPGRPPTSPEPRRRSRPTSAAFPSLPPLGAGAEDASPTSSSTGPSTTTTNAAPPRTEKRSSISSDRTARPAPTARFLAPVNENGPSSRTSFAASSDYETAGEEEQQRSRRGSEMAWKGLGLEAEVAAAAAAAAAAEYDEEKDRVESLPRNQGGGGGGESRDRSSSSVSGASSMWERVRSRESLATSTRTSTSSLGGVGYGPSSSSSKQQPPMPSVVPISPSAADDRGQFFGPATAQEVVIGTALGGGEDQGGKLLVNSHTGQGTISQRRRSPLPDEEATPRKPSSSLPQRLRALSQPGRRTSAATTPAMPLPVTGLVPAMSRKASQSSTSSVANDTRSASPAFIPSSGVNTPVLEDRSTTAASGQALLGPFGAIMVAPPAQGRLPPIPSQPARRPFHLMRQIRATILQGGYLTPRLYVPQAAWAQTNVALKNVEGKVKLIEILIAALEGVAKEGDALLPKASPSASATDLAQREQQQPPSPTQMGLAAGERFIKRLDAFEDVLDQVQATLVKKLNLATSGPSPGEFGSGAGKKASGLGGFGQKLSRSIDRITNAKNLDAPATYVDGIARLFWHAQVIDRHLACILPPSPPSTPYAGLGPQIKQQIEQRLKRVSDFYGGVVTRFVVADLGLLLDVGPLFFSPVRKVEG